MKTSYVSGANSFVAYNQDGSLNGLEYAKNLIILQSYSNWYVEYRNELENLQLVDVFVTTGNITGQGSLKLYVAVKNTFNGATFTDILWTAQANQPSFSVGSDYIYSARNLDYPIQKSNQVIFSNANNISLDIKRVTLVFRHLILSILP